MKNRQFIINGEILEPAKARVSIDDYGLMRGYAVFETIRFENKTPRNLDNQLP